MPFPPAQYPSLVIQYPSTLLPLVTDQPQGPLDIDVSTYTNQVFAELMAMELTLGLFPFKSLPKYSSVNQALHDLYYNKASGAVDATGIVQRGGHVHSHNASNNLTDPFNVQNDHPQYLRTQNPVMNGPLVAPNSTGVMELITLGQLQSFGFIRTSDLAGTVNAAMVGKIFGGQTVCAGFVSGVTDASGNISCLFGGAFHTAVYSFVITQMPGNPGFGRPVYNFSEDVLLVRFTNIERGVVHFFDDSSSLRQRAVAFTFIAVGN